MSDEETEQSEQNADYWKNIGNDFYKSKNYKAAVDAYSK
jgi:hypothetical protein